MAHSLYLPISHLWGRMKLIVLANIMCLPYCPNNMASKPALNLVQSFSIFSKSSHNFKRYGQPFPKNAIIKSLRGDKVPMFTTNSMIPIYLLFISLLIELMQVTGVERNWPKHESDQGVYSGVSRKNGTMLQSYKYMGFTGRTKRRWNRVWGWNYVYSPMRNGFYNLNF